MNNIHSLVRNKKQIETVYEEIKEKPGIILCTLYDIELKKTLQALCDELSIPLIDPLDTIHQSLTSVYGIKGSPIVGGQHQLNTEYFERIDAMNYTLAHDDGIISGDLKCSRHYTHRRQSNIKTPTSIYLANRGIKTANIPFVNNIPLPPELIP